MSEESLKRAVTQAVPDAHLEPAARLRTAWQDSSKSRHAPKSGRMPAFFVPDQFELSS